MKELQELMSWIILEYANQHKERIFLYGAKQEVVEAAAKIFNDNIQGLLLAVFYMAIQRKTARNCGTN